MQRGQDWMSLKTEAPQVSALGRTFSFWNLVHFDFFVTCSSALPEGPATCAHLAGLKDIPVLVQMPQNWNWLKDAGISRGDTGKLCFTKMATGGHIPSHSLCYMWCSSSIDRSSMFPLTGLCSLSFVTALTKRGQLCDFWACSIKAIQLLPDSLLAPHSGNPVSMLWGSPGHLGRLRAAIPTNSANKGANISHHHQSCTWEGRRFHRIAVPWLELPLRLPNASGRRVPDEGLPQLQICEQSKCCLEPLSLGMAYYTAADSWTKSLGVKTWVWFSLWNATPEGR